MTRRSKRTGESSKGSRPWRRILYDKQPYDDNYVDDSFLEELVTNANVRNYDYWDLSVSSAVIIQEICSVVIFFTVFVYTRSNQLSFQELLRAESFILICGYIILALYDPLATNQYLYFKSNARQCFLFISMLSILSPVLRTLTVSYADDSIWALAIAFAVLHLMCHDYTYVNTGRPKYIGTLSLNAAVFTSVLLSSRLQTNEHVMLFLLLAIELFAISPIARFYIRRKSVRSHVALTLFMLILASVLMYPLSVMMVVVLWLATIVISFICPLWFLYIQQFKREIQGPWDIAKVQALH